MRVTANKIVLFLGGALMFAAGVSPEDARSNIAGWYQAITSDSAPEWMNASHVDTIIIYGVLVILALYFAISFWRKRRMGEEKNPPTFTGIYTEGIDGLSIKENRIRGANKGIDVRNSEKVEIERNDIQKGENGKD